MSEESQSEIEGRYPEGDAVSTFDFKVYARAGLSRTEALEWAAAGVRPYQAEGFAAAGIDLDTAARYTRDYAMTGQFAARCVERGIDPEDEAKALRDERAAEDRRVAAIAQARADLVERARHLHVGASEITDLVQRSEAQVSRWATTGAFGDVADVVDGNDRYKVGAVLDFLRDKDPDGYKDMVRPEWAWGVIVQSLPPGGRSMQLVTALVALADSLRPADGQFDQRRKLSEIDMSTPEGKDEVRQLAMPLRNLPKRGEIIGDIDLIIDGLQDPSFGDLTTCLDLSIDAGLDLAVLLDDALDALSDLTPKNDTSTTPHALAEVMLSLADPLLTRGGNIVVFDPGAGTGELLLWCARRGGSGTTVIGHEIDPAVARIARTRLMLRGINGRIVTTDSFASGDNPEGLETRGQADLVVCDVPYTKSRTKLTAWIDVAFESLKEGGQAVLALPSGSLPTLDGPGSDAPLARRPSHLDGLVLLPRRIRPGVRGDIVIAVLSTDTHDTVGVLDLRGDTFSTTARMLRPSRRRSAKSSDQVSGRSRDWVQHPVSSRSGYDLSKGPAAGDAQFQRVELAHLAAAVRPAKKPAPPRPEGGPTTDGDARHAAAALLAALSESDQDRALAATLRERFGL